MRLLMYDRGGKRLADIDSLPTVEHVLNGAGKLTFTLTTNNPKCKEQFLQYGNIALLEDDELGDWVGVVRVPRGWPPGKLNVHCNEAPALFGRRKLTENVKLTGTAGSIYRQIIDWCNGEEDLLLRAGQIFDGGVSREETMSDRALVHIQRVAQRSGNDFMIRAETDNQNHLYLACDWMSRAGIDTGLTLEEGEDLTYEAGTELLVEDVEGGELINRVIGLGDAPTSGTRLVTPPIEDGISQGAYGLGTDRVVFSGNTVMDTLQANAVEYLLQRSTPRYQVRGLINMKRAQALRIGNVFALKLHSVGFLPGGGIGFENRGRLGSIRYTYGNADASVTFLNAS